ncbi:hypothetical protein LFL97_38590 (plasmid) [Burkholderia sp. JSH-S8]|nr:hypothetical protein LFL97_38590 [Burkholderia sp. JSH-S8]
MLRARGIGNGTLLPMALLKVRSSINRPTEVGVVLSMTALR